MSLANQLPVTIVGAVDASTVSGTNFNAIYSRAAVKSVIIANPEPIPVNIIGSNFIDKALVGGSNVTVVSGSNTITISSTGGGGGGGEVPDALVGAGGIVVTSGSNTTTIDGSGISGGGAAPNALVGSNGVTVVSGSSTDTISGFYSEFTSASGTLQTDINTRATSASLSSHTGDGTIHFTEGSIDHTAIQNIGSNTHAQIDSHIADSSIHQTASQILNQGRALVGGSNVTVTSGSNTITIAAGGVSTLTASGTTVSGAVTLAGSGGSWLSVAGQTITVNSNTSHAALSGLSNNDHPQYAQRTANENITGSWNFINGENKFWTTVSGISRNSSSPVFILTSSGSNPRPAFEIASTNLNPIFRVPGGSDYTVFQAEASSFQTLRFNTGATFLSTITYSDGLGGTLNFILGTVVGSTTVSTTTPLLLLGGSGGTQITISGTGTPGLYSAGGITAAGNFTGLRGDFNTGLTVSGSAVLNLNSQYVPRITASGTNITGPVTLAGTGNVALRTSGSTVTVSGMPSIIQVVEATNNTRQTGTSSIPTDGTIPQSGEGTQILSISITPRFANSTLLIEHEGVYAGSSGAAILVLAVFRSDSSDSILSMGPTVPTNNYTFPVRGSVRTQANTTSPLTISLRIGIDAGTWYTQTASASPLFGGSERTVLRVTELR